MERRDITFDSKERAVEFVRKKFPDFTQEVAKRRSAEGWHFDVHRIVEGGKAIEHINIYSKSLKFRVHLFWD